MDYRKIYSNLIFKRKQCAAAAKLIRSKRLEYKGQIYLGYLDLLQATGVSKHLYKKFYLKGFDPEDRIGKDGPSTTQPKKLGGVCG